MTDSQQAALDSLFLSLCPGDAPGLVVGVAQQGRTVYRCGFGLASIEHGVANTPWTRMRIGSTSKQFTCLAALLLAEEGRLDLDASVREVLPELPPLEAEPTLRQLMTHTSGYRCYLDLGFISDGMAIKPPGAAWATQLRQREANFAPGSNMVYCNSGYHLLSLAIERRSGMRFEAFLQQRIFTPLGMRNTCSVPSDLELHPGVATLHVPRPAAQGGGWRRGIFPSEELRGEGAMISTIDDMLRWLAHLRAPTLGSAASWQQMLAPTRLSTGLVNPYGLGLMRHDYRGVEVIHHPGGVIGGASQMLTVPSEGLDIIVISNGAQASPRELAHRIVDTLLGDERLGPAAVHAASTRFGPMLGRRYVGRDSGLLIGFAEAAGGTLGLCLANGPALPLRDEGEQLRQPFEDMAIGPFELATDELATEGDAPPVLQLREAGHSEHFELLAPTPPALAGGGAALAGRYRSPDLAADALIQLEGGRLFLQIFGAYGGNRLELQAFSADVFGCQEIDPHQVQPRAAALRVQRRAGRVAGFRIDTPRTRHLCFERLDDAHLPNDLAS
ncbi:serine hydrolase domain-containing protein [Paucibacter sp. R3-3]|uniref:Serine hydrolase domain-containing protein n=1 Tax=Roseateles agri TaxID=3098619 RepID=A0ABU5DAW4_9BURK|nr:serine hydrolase domain-containing protein [Paucibacter sp. R3-3]MDY0743374.1 serine hydrolase domain-containing protein [Paucibacter sp. R3-3]